MNWTEWSPSEDHLMMLGGIIALIKPSVVVEYGAGLTTKLLRRLAPGRWITIEHQAEYATAAAAAGAEAVLVDADKYARWPIGKVKADLVIVDGIERSACLEAAREFLAPNGLVALHDAEREEFLDLADSWDLLVYNTEGYVAHCSDGADVFMNVRALAIMREKRDAVRQ